MSFPASGATVPRTERELQKAYYERTASNYDELHLSEPEHYIGLRYISTLLPSLDVHRVLDVGCGTGRGVAELRRLHPGLEIFGVEPVQGLINEAIAKGVPRSALIRGDGYGLPFPDGTFDAAMALGVLHHVARPELVVREMLRVAKKAVFVSDSNIFGQGSAPIRILKFLLYKAGLWKMAKRIQTRGRGYTITQSDGLAYSYSVFFQRKILSEWAQRFFTIPTCDGSGSPWLVEPFGYRCLLVCAIRD